MILFLIRTSNIQSKLIVLSGVAAITLLIVLSGVAAITQLIVLSGVAAITQRKARP
jgi:hypothetical protein